MFAYFYFDQIRVLLLSWRRSRLLLRVNSKNMKEQQLMSKWESHQKLKSNHKRKVCKTEPKIIIAKVKYLISRLILDMCLTREVSRLLERSRDSSCSKRGPRTLDRASRALWGRDWGREGVETRWVTHVSWCSLSTERNVYTKQLCVHTAITMHSSVWIAS